MVVCVCGATEVDWVECNDGESGWGLASLVEGRREETDCLGVWRKGEKEGE